MCRGFEELIDTSNAHDVRYLVNGADAVAFHALPRATNDPVVLRESNGRGGS